MQIINLLNTVWIWFKDNYSGIMISIIASIIMGAVKVVKNVGGFLTRIFEHIGWQDRRGMKYIIVQPIKKETKKDMLREVFQCFIRVFAVFVPSILLLILLKITIFIAEFNKIGVFGIILGVFIVTLCVLNMQKYDNNKFKLYKILTEIFIVVILLISSSIVIFALIFGMNNNLAYYAVVISLMIFLMSDIFLENKYLKHDYMIGTGKIRWIKYFIMIIGYIIFAGSLKTEVLNVIFYFWSFICLAEYFCAVFLTNLFVNRIDKKMLTLYTIKCRAGTYITHNRILQMKDGKVNFKKDDQDIYIIEKRGIECITYEIKNLKTKKNNKQTKIIYVTKDGKETMCDRYAYIKEEWIEFSKEAGANIEKTLIPSDQINSIRSCNKREGYSIVNEE